MITQDLKSNCGTGQLIGSADRSLAQPTKTEAEDIWCYNILKPLGEVSEGVNTLNINTQNREIRKELPEIADLWNISITYEPTLKIKICRDIDNSNANFKMPYRSHQREEASREGRPSITGPNSPPPDPDFILKNCYLEEIGG